MELTLLSRVQGLLLFIQERPIEIQLANYLSENFAPNGSQTPITVSRLRDDGKIVCEIAQGFKESETILGSEVDIGDDRPGSHAMRSVRTLILNKADFVGNYRNFVPEEFMAHFQTAVIMSVSMRKIYGLALIDDVEATPAFREYVEVTRTILSLYDYISHGGMGAHIREPNKDTNKLTHRQEVILNMIKENKTNATIASELGYSESLIRQETIIIYRKLGVSGRKDLLPEVPA